MQQVDMYKVYRQVYGRAWHIKYADHINANKGKALAMARSNPSKMYVQAGASH